jgi:hypothetical protein
MKIASGVKSVFLGIIGLVLTLSLTFPANAQVISGNLVGTVFDKTGAFVPNVTIEAVSVGTNLKYASKTSESGEYRFTNLPVGTYNVSASSPDFATTIINGVGIELNGTRTLTITLEVKGTSASVEVTALAATLDTTSAQITNTFDGKQIADLPTPSTGSGVLNLSLLNAGVATGGGLGVGMGPSVGGQRPRNNNFTIEGVDNNDKSLTGALVNVPNDAVAEFSLLQNQFSPEYGHSSGGQFNTVVKSGTNSFHGLAYIYNQTRSYNALDTLQRIEGFSATPRLDQNRIGGQLGGPILKDKLFFFGNYEYSPLGQAGGSGAVCSPTASSYAVIAATPGISATNLEILQKYVAPGSLDHTKCGPIDWVGNTKLPTAGLEIVAPSYTNSKFVTSSIDYNVSSKDQLRGRYIYNSVVGLDTSAGLPAFYLPAPNKFHLLAINEYHTFSPTLTNEIRLGFNRFTQVTDAGNFSFPGLDSFPNLQFDDLGQLQIGPDPGAPQGRIQNTYQLAEAITWTKNKHTLTFGVEGRKIIGPESFTQRERGDYEYGNLLRYLQDLEPDSVAERSNGNPVYYGDQAAIYWFANDNWRIRPNLTINLGLRYEYTTIPFSQRLQSLNEAASVPGLIEFKSPRAAKNNWGPRVGFAYSPGKNAKTSIRVGAGIAYDILFDNLGITTLPPQLSSTIDCFPVGNFTCNSPGFLAAGGIPPGEGGLRTFDTIAEQRAATSAYVSNDQKLPKSINWTLGVQHTFGSDYTVEVRYIGTRGIHLPTQTQLNKQSVVTSSLFLPTYKTAPSQATLDASTLDLAGLESLSPIVPAYAAAGFDRGNITTFAPRSSSTYNGLAAQVNKRMGHGFQLVGAYTFSHLIDNATAELFSTVLAPRRAQDSQNLSADRANSILDHRHRFTLALLYDEPFFRNSNRFFKNTLGNWEIAPIYTYQSGQWSTAQSGVDSNLNGDSAPDRTIFNAGGVSGTGSGVVPLCTSAVASCPTTLSDARTNPDGVVGYLATNPNAQYIQAGYGALADVGRNTLQLRPINDVDLTVVKRISISERVKVEFQVHAFNLFNHPQWVGGFVNDVAPSASFITFQRNILLPANLNFNQPDQVFSSNPRSLQLALKFSF